MAPPLLDAPETFEAVGEPGSRPVSILSARRDALVDRASGRILHVAGQGRGADELAEALSQLDDAPIGADGAVNRPFDSVISVLALTTAPEPVDVLNLLVRLVVQGGRLLLLESTRRPPDASTPIASRFIDRLQSRRPAESNSPLRTDLDIPTMVRSSGFSPTRVERFGLGPAAETTAFVSIEAGRRSELRPLDHAAEGPG